MVYERYTAILVLMDLLRMTSGSLSLLSLVSRAYPSGNYSSK
jgi:hypothetical protein